MSKNLSHDACRIASLPSYSSEMRIALQSGTPELIKLLDRFRERRELMPLKARALKGLAAELGAVYGIGLPWKEIWRALAECGYEGSYPAILADGCTAHRHFYSQTSKAQGPPAPCSGGKRFINRWSAKAARTAGTKRQRRNLNGKYRESRKWRDWIAKRN